MSHDAFEMWTGRPQAWMCELQAHFGRDRNPIHAWQAIRLALSCKMPLPEWVVSYLLTSAEQITKMAENGELKLAVKQAEMIGRALGFGAKGRGGRFRQAALVERDEEMFRNVITKTRPVIKIANEEVHSARGDKLDTAYDIVAAEWRVDRSTVVRACSRVLRRWRAAGMSGELREALRSMAAYVRFQQSIYKDGQEQLEDCVASNKWLSGDD